VGGRRGFEVDAIWVKRLDLLAMLFALVFLVAYAFPILRPDAPESLRAACRTTVWATWALLAVEVSLRFFYADNRRRFFRNHWLDVAAVALPVLRPLRLLRLVLLVSVLQRHVGRSLIGRVGVYVGGAITLTSFVASLAVLEVERESPDGNIRTYGDSIWWVMTTLSTVGYGDHYPVTTTGRCIAVALMVVGVALLGVVTASLATWLIEQVREIEEESEALQRQDILALREEVSRLRLALESTSDTED
jgi:voltage-gated potassium channel